MINALAHWLTYHRSFHPLIHENDTDRIWKHTLHPVFLQTLYHRLSALFSSAYDLLHPSTSHSDSQIEDLSCLGVCFGFPEERFDSIYDHLNWQRALRGGLILLNLAEMSRQKRRSRTMAEFWLTIEEKRSWRIILLHIFPWVTTYWHRYPNNHHLRGGYPHLLFYDHSTLVAIITNFGISCG